MKELTYTLRAYFTYNGEYVNVPHKLRDKLSNLFILICAHQFVVLEDRKGFIPTEPATWWWEPAIDIASGRPGAMHLAEPIVRFDTLDQAVAYIDIIKR